MEEVCRRDEDEVPSIEREMFGIEGGRISLQTRQPRHSDNSNNNKKCSNKPDSL